MLLNKSIMHLCHTNTEPHLCLSKSKTSHFLSNPNILPFGLGAQHALDVEWKWDAVTRKNDETNAGEHNVAQDDQPKNPASADLCHLAQ